MPECHGQLPSIIPWSDLEATLGRGCEMAHIVTMTPWNSYCFLSARLWHGCGSWCHQDLKILQVMWILPLSQIYITTSSSYVPETSSLTSPSFGVLMHKVGTVAIPRATLCDCVGCALQSQQPRGSMEVEIQPRVHSPSHIFLRLHFLGGGTVF